MYTILSCGITESGVNTLWALLAEENLEHFRMHHYPLQTMAKFKVFAIEIRGKYGLQIKKTPPPLLL